MTDVEDIDEYTAEEPLVLPARLEREETYTPRWTGLVGPVQTLVEILPSHKSTRKGRKSAKRFRTILGAVSFVTVVFSPSAWLTIAALLVLVGIVPWLPLPEMRKRDWINRLKKLRSPRSRTITRPARIVYDGRRVALDKGGNTLRRVLTDRDEHRFRAGTVADRLYLELAPADSHKKSDAIWVGTDDLEPADLDADLSDLPPDRVDRPALVTDEDWRTLLAVLRALED